MITNNKALWHCMWCTHYFGTPPYITRHFSASLTRQRYSSVWVTPLWLESSTATPDVNSVGQCYWRIISIFAGHNLPIWSIYGAIVIDRKYPQIQVFWINREIPRDSSRPQPRPLVVGASGRINGSGRRLVIVIKITYNWSF